MSDNIEPLQIPPVDVNVEPAIGSAVEIHENNEYNNCTKKLTIKRNNFKDRRSEPAKRAAAADAAAAAAAAIVAAAAAANVDSDAVVSTRDTISNNIQTTSTNARKKT